MALFSTEYNLDKNYRGLIAAIILQAIDDAKVGIRQDDFVQSGLFEDYCTVLGIDYRKVATVLTSSAEPKGDAKGSQRTKIKGKIVATRADNRESSCFASLGQAAYRLHLPYDVAVRCLASGEQCGCYYLSKLGRPKERGKE